MPDRADQEPACLSDCRGPQRQRHERAIDAEDINLAQTNRSAGDTHRTTTRDPVAGAVKGPNWTSMRGHKPIAPPDRVTAFRNMRPQDGQQVAAARGEK